MEYITRSEAPFDGTVTAFYFQSGELVTDGAQLLEVEPLAAEPEKMADASVPSDGPSDTKGA